MSYRFVNAAVGCVINEGCGAASVQSWSAFRKAERPSAQNSSA